MIDNPVDADVIIEQHDVTGGNPDTDRMRRRALRLRRLLLRTDPELCVTGKVTSQFKPRAGTVIPL